jgi:hypothetical protein
MFNTVLQSEYKSDSDCTKKTLYSIPMTEYKTVQASVRIAMRCYSPTII